jgi:hypothetical protein
MGADGMKAQEQAKQDPGARRPWEDPALRSVGALSEVLAAGSGKLSPSADDSGDDRKPKGLG